MHLPRQGLPKHDLRIAHAAVAAAQRASCDMQRHVPVMARQTLEQRFNRMPPSPAAVMAADLRCVLAQQIGKHLMIESSTPTHVGIRTKRAR